MPENSRQATREQLIERGAAVLDNMIDTLGQQNPELAERYRQEIGDTRVVVRGTGYQLNNHLAAALEEIHRFSNTPNTMQLLTLLGENPQSAINAIVSRAGERYYQEVIEGRTPQEAEAADQEYWKQNARSATDGITLDGHTPTLPVPEKIPYPSLSIGEDGSLQARVLVDGIEYGRNGDIRNEVHLLENEQQALRNNLANDTRTPELRSKNGNTYLYVPLENTVSDPQAFRTNPAGAPEFQAVQNEMRQLNSSIESNRTAQTPEPAERPVQQFSAETMEEVRRRIAAINGDQPVARSTPSREPATQSPTESFRGQLPPEVVERIAASNENPPTPEGQRRGAFNVRDIREQIRAQNNSPSDEPQPRANRRPPPPRPGAHGNDGHMHHRDGSTSEVRGEDGLTLRERQDRAHVDAIYEARQNADPATPKPNVEIYWAEGEQQLTPEAGAEMMKKLGYRQTPDEIATRLLAGIEDVSPRSTIQIDIVTTGGSAYVDASILDNNGKATKIKFSLSRQPGFQANFADGSINPVSIGLIKTDEGLTNGTKYFGNIADIAAHEGATRVSFQADMQDGPYTWAKLGAIPDPSSWRRFRDGVEKRLDYFQEQLSTPEGREALKAAGTDLTRLENDITALREITQRESVRTDGKTNLRALTTSSTAVPNVDFAQDPPKIIMGENGKPEMTSLSRAVMSNPNFKARNQGNVYYNAFLPLEMDASEPHVRLFQNATGKKANELQSAIDETRRPAVVDLDGLVDEYLAEDERAAATDVETPKPTTPSDESPTRTSQPDEPPPQSRTTIEAEPVPTTATPASTPDVPERTPASQPEPTRSALPKGAIRTQGITGSIGAAVGLGNGSYMAYREFSKNGLSKDFLVYSGTAAYDAADLVTSLMQSSGKTTQLGQTLSRYGLAVQSATAIYAIANEDTPEHKLQQAAAQGTTIAAGYTGGMAMGALGGRALGTVGGMIVGAGAGFAIGYTAAVVTQGAIEVSRIYENEDARFEGVNRDTMEKFRSLSGRMRYLADDDPRIKMAEGGALDLKDDYTREQVIKEIDNEIKRADQAKTKNESWVPRWARRDFESLGEYNTAIADLAFLKSAQEESVAYSHYIAKERAIEKLGDVETEMVAAMKRGSLHQLVSLSDEKIDALKEIAARTRNDDVRESAQEQLEIATLQKTSYEVAIRLERLAPDGVLPKENIEEYKELTAKLAGTYDQLAEKTKPDFEQLEVEKRLQSDAFARQAKNMRNQYGEIEFTQLTERIANMEKGHLSEDEKQEYAQLVRQAAEQSSALMDSRTFPNSENFFHYDDYTVAEYRESVSTTGFKLSGENLERSVTEFATGKALFEREKQWAEKLASVENGNYLENIRQNYDAQMTVLAKASDTMGESLAMLNTTLQNPALTQDDLAAIARRQQTPEVIASQTSYNEAQARYDALTERAEKSATNPYIGAPSTKELQRAEMEMLEAKVIMQQTQGQAMLASLPVVEARLDAMEKQNATALTGLEKLGPETLEGIQQRQQSVGAVISEKYNLAELATVINPKSSEEQRTAALASLEAKGVDIARLTPQTIQQNFLQAQQEILSDTQNAITQRQQLLTEFSEPQKREALVGRLMNASFVEHDSQHSLIVNGQNGTNYRMLEPAIEAENATAMAKRLNALGDSTKPAFKVVLNDSNQEVLAVDVAHLNERQLVVIYDEQKNAADIQLAMQQQKSNAPEKALAGQKSEEKPVAQPEQKAGNRTASLPTQDDLQAIFAATLGKDALAIVDNIQRIMGGVISGGHENNDHPNNTSIASLPTRVGSNDINLS